MTSGTSLTRGTLDQVISQTPARTAPASWRPSRLAKTCPCRPGCGRNSSRIGVGLANETWRRNTFEMGPSTAASFVRIPHMSLRRVSALLPGLTGCDQQYVGNSRQPSHKDLFCIHFSSFSINNDLVSRGSAFPLEIFLTSPTNRPISPFFSFFIFRDLVGHPRQCLVDPGFSISAVSELCIRLSAAADLQRIAIRLFQQHGEDAFWPRWKSSTFLPPHPASASPARPRNRSSFQAQSFLIETGLHRSEHPIGRRFN